MCQSFAYASARAWSRLATPTSSTLSDACAPGITFRLMSAVETMPHLTTSTCVVSRRGRDRCWHAGLRVHGEGALERVQEDRVHHVAAAARAAARRDRRARRRSRHGRAGALRVRVRDAELARADRRRA